MRNKQFILTIIFLSFTALSVFAQNERTTTDVITFPKLGKVRMEIKEKLGKPTVIKFWKNKLNVGSYTLRNGDNYLPDDFNSAVSSVVKYRILEKIEGLPHPLIQVLAIQPGGSDHGFWTILFAEINGAVKMITPAKIENSIQGGVHFGSLGKGNGVGLAVFNFVWGKNEPHYGIHRYQVELYRFNATTGLFVKAKKFVSKKKHEDEFGALRELGFSKFTNRLNDFPGILDYRETEEGAGKN